MYTPMGSTQNVGSLVSQEATQRKPVPPRCYHPTVRLVAKRQKRHVQLEGGIGFLDLARDQILDGDVVLCH